MLFSKLSLLFAGLGPSVFVAASLMQPREAGLEVTSVTYKGSGCPQGSLTGVFEPATNSFNVTVQGLRAELEKDKGGDHARCHIVVGLRTSASRQINVLRGDFHGHVYLQKGMTAYEKNTYSFAGSPGTTEMKWPFTGPVNLDTVFTNTMNTTLVSQCGGDFTLQIDNELILRRGNATKDAEGYINVSSLTGNLGNTIVLEQKECTN
ncbi:Secreted protein [Penicillium canescens]|nr:Secreted protein [Penicillium canescens]KAJ6060974.1 Secreted protein [Penicillium canescens]KAJ6088911.1 Secreted protein [Penicillium canescens]KAJ6174316.1 Secreted protein [Penicillium canescens]